MTHPEDTARGAPEEELARFFELSLDHLVVAGFDGYFKRLNPAWARTLGWTMEELLSTPSMEFVHPDDRERTLAARENLIVGMPATGLVNRYLCKGGGHRWFQWMSISYVDRRRVYAVARDITDERRAREERERLREQLIASDRQASVGRLAAGVAHEINNPLSTVISNLRFALSGLEQGDPASGEAAELTEALREGLAGAQRVADIVRDLGAFSRASDQPTRPVRVDAALDLCLALMAGEIRRFAELVREVGDTPLVAADESRLTHVFLNLLVNAMQALADQDRSANRILVRTATDAEGRAVVEIEDSGPGMPPDVLPYVLDPFFTTRPLGKGAGLGLSISRSLVAQFGGELSIESLRRGGTRVRVVVPPA